MFFLASKIIWAILMPLNLLWILILLGLIVQKAKGIKIQGFLSITLYVFLILGVLPIGNNLTVFLENQYHRPNPMPSKVDGIIVLGGGFNAELAHQVGMMTANNEINRVIDFVELSKKYPKAKLVYSGGSGKIFYQDMGESAIAEKFLKLSAIDGGRVIYEEKSRNTYENVLNSKKMLKPKEGEKWILVSSSYHLPRAMGVFQKQGWKVIPYPSSPKTLGKYRILPNEFDVGRNFNLLQTALKEIIGSVIYYVSGKSSFILPLSLLESSQSSA